MIRVSTISAALACTLAAGAACAYGPGVKAGAPYHHARLSLAPPSLIDGPTPYAENFDAYAAGSSIGGQGGWSVWYSGGSNATVEGPATAPAATSAPNKLRLVTGSDVVQLFTIDDGKWTFKIKTYVPSSSTPGIGGMVIMLNQYGSAAIDNWSIQLSLNDTQFAGGTTVPFMIESQYDGGVLPLILDQWVEIRSEIDLDLDQVTHFYNNQMLGAPHLYSSNGFGSGPGITTIACLDLWSAGTNALYFDDISLVEVVDCYPDCNNTGTLTIADFGCFQAAFAGGNMYADCNSSGTLTIADFGCFQAAFAAGCP